jgi:hypothetical protein
MSDLVGRSTSLARRLYLLFHAGVENRRLSRARPDHSLLIDAACARPPSNQISRLIEESMRFRTAPNGQPQPGVVVVSADGACSVVCATAGFA